jgi:hypothetical protein
MTSRTVHDAKALPNEFRKAIRHLRSGVPSPAAARLITVGTDTVEHDLRKRENAWIESGFRPQMAFVLGDWGFGKTHLRMLLVDSFLQRGIPFVQDSVDGKTGSLAHLHRAVPRWMESIQVGDHTGLRPAIEAERQHQRSIRSWCAKRKSAFSNNLMRAIDGREWAWSLAAGHQFQFPDYSYNHSKALEILEDFASLLASLSKAGIVLMLDEAENVSRQHDIRGRRKTYDTLWKLAGQRHLLSFVFVTERFFQQIEEDKQRGTREGWSSWTTEAKDFVTKSDSIPIAKPPRLNSALAGALVDRIVDVYRAAFRCSPPEGLKEEILDAWHRTATRSVRLLVRISIDALDCSVV